MEPPRRLLARAAAALPRAAPLLALPLLAASAAGAEPEEAEVPFVASPSKVVDRMLELADVGPGDYVIDLGSGDGRIVVEAARRGAFGHGVEIDPELTAEARHRAERAGVSARVVFLRQDLFESDVREASVVTLYLFAEVNEKLRPRLLEQLRPGTRVVSHDFGMGPWQPDAVSRISAPGLLQATAGDEGTAGDAGSRPAAGGREGEPAPETEPPQGEGGPGPALLGEPSLLGEPDVTGSLEWPPRAEAERLLDLHRVFLWVVPADARGRWRWEIEDRPFRLEVEQRFQEVELRARSQGRALEVEEAELRGRRLAFVAGRDGRRYAFSGRIEGDAIAGTVQLRSEEAGEGRVLRWSAERVAGPGRRDASLGGRPPAEGAQSTSAP